MITRWLFLHCAYIYVLALWLHLNDSVLLQLEFQWLWKFFLFLSLGCLGLLDVARRAYTEIVDDVTGE